jgi:hypothetical protein
MKTWNLALRAVGLLVLLGWAGSIQATSPPERVNFQGVLRDAAGAPANGDFEMVFVFFGDGVGACDCLEVNGSPGCNDATCDADVCASNPGCCSTTWDSACVAAAEAIASCQVCAADEEALTDDHSAVAGVLDVTVTDGLFNVALGSGFLSDGSGPGTYASLGEVFRDYDLVYLETRVGGEILSPRIRVESSAFTQNAGHLEGRRAVDFLDTTATPQTKAGDLDVQGDVSVGGGVAFADGTVLTSARPDPACFDSTLQFVNCGNGTVTDTATGLIWLEDAACLGIGEFATANQVAAGLADGACALTDNSSPGDWRLPTLAEWDVIIDQATANGCTTPWIPGAAGNGCCATGVCPFIGVQSVNYWSSSTVAGIGADAHRADVGDGNTSTALKDNILWIWPVRDGR